MKFKLRTQVEVIVKLLFSKFNDNLYKKGLQQFMSPRKGRRIFFPPKKEKKAFTGNKAAFRSFSGYFHA